MRSLARPGRPRDAVSTVHGPGRRHEGGTLWVKKALLSLTIGACVLFGAGPVFGQAAPPSSARKGSESGSGQAPAPAAEPRKDKKAAPEAAPPSGGAPAVDGAEYRIRLRELEQKVEALKEQIRQSHARLSLLSDTILAGGQGGGRVNIRFENELSAAWHIVEITVVFDGAVQYKKSDDSGALSAQKKTPIFSGAVPAGDHTVQVLIKLRGHGFGVFSYLRGIEANVRHDHSFTLTAGQDIEVVAVAWEQGGPTTPAEKRPDVRFHEVLHKAAGQKATVPARSRKKGKSAPSEPGGKE